MFAVWEETPLRFPSLRYGTWRRTARVNDRVILWMNVVYCTSDWCFVLVLWGGREWQRLPSPHSAFSVEGTRIRDGSSAHSFSLLRFVGIGVEGTHTVIRVCTHSKLFLFCLFFPVRISFGYRRGEWRGMSLPSDASIETTTYGGLVNAACHGTGKTQARRSFFLPTLQLQSTHATKGT